MRNFRRAVVTLALFAVVAAAGAPSYADSVCAHDETGDAVRAIDMTGMRLDNAAHAVRIRIYFADLDRSRIGRIRAQVDTGRPLGLGYFVEFRRRPAGGFSRYLEKAPMYGEYTGNGIACHGLTLSWGKDVADIRLPRTCMKGASDRVRGEVFVDNLRETRSDNIPDGALFTRWVPRG